jgi:hypothetical protein
MFGYGSSASLGYIVFEILCWVPIILRLSFRPPFFGGVYPIFGVQEKLRAVYFQPNFHLPLYISAELIIPAYFVMCLII